MLRAVFMVWLSLMVVLISAAIFKALIADMLMGIFFAGMVVVVCLLVWLLCAVDPRDMRWIDAASVQMSPFSMYPSIPFSSVRRGSDVRIIEEQIAQREQRLRELEPST